MTATERGRVMAAHTPGSWIAELSANSFGSNGRFTICKDTASDARTLICEMPHAFARRSQAAESEANARLIAAAPDMLEAPKLAAKELNAIRARDGAPQHIDWYRGIPMQTSSCTDEWWDELTETCFAAIAKATGDDT